MNKSLIIQSAYKFLSIPNLIKSENLSSICFANYLASDKYKNVFEGTLPHHSLEKKFGVSEETIKVRREYIEQKNEFHLPNGLNNLPVSNFNYEEAYGVCCENMVGYIQIPVGVAGPLLINNTKYFVPLATTEGALIASTSRGCKAITQSGGATAIIYRDGMTRAPLIRMDSAFSSAELAKWIHDPLNFPELEKIFNSTSNHAKLTSIDCTLTGKNIYLRFCCSTGDAMGMNMISKAVQATLSHLKTKFPKMEVKSLSGNLCSDKKSAAVNWISGRGKSVICEATITKEILQSVLKTNAKDLVDLNVNKNYIGSALAHTIGGNNAHASNIVTSIFLATGQDVAQTIESSNCITVMEKLENDDLYISCSMPSIEVGTVGGGTNLSSQSACLELLGVKGSSQNGINAKNLAQIVCGTVVAAELSLMSALTTGDLVKSHLLYNRK